MRFLCLYRPAPSAAPPGPPNAEHMAALGALIEEMRRDGSLIDTGGVAAREPRVRVRRNGAEMALERGPIAEARDPVLGYALISAASMEEAITLTKRFLSVAGDGESEILPLFDGPA